MSKIIFETIDFNESEIISDFHKWFIEQNNRRLIKKGKLFEFTYSDNSIVFGDVQLFAGLCDDPFKQYNIDKKCDYVVTECLKIAVELSHELNIVLEFNKIPDAMGSICVCKRKEKYKYD